MRVGTSPLGVYSVHAWQDHPHACGDKEAVIPQFLMLIGSSPCVWGQEVADKVSVKSARIIPMRVGTSNFTIRAAQQN